MMKYLLLLAVIFGMVWWIKLSRRPSNHDQPSASSHSPQNMVQCAYCGLHLPDNEAVVSRNANYCSEAHRALADKST